MKVFRYRKPSVNRMLGISRAKSQFTRATGGAAVRNPKALVKNYERRVKRRAGYYSPAATAYRNRKGCLLGWFRLW